MNTRHSILTILIALLLPFGCFAASGPVLTVVQPKAFGVGDTVIVPIMLAVPETQQINSLQARVSVSGAARLTSVSNGGSVFLLWPEGPTQSGNSVSFIGGTPGTIYGSPLKVITLALTGTAAGSAKVTISGAVAYKGDGTGTPIPLKDASTIVHVGSKSQSPRNELASTLAHDVLAPDTFNISVGRDPSLYENQYFISFATVDAGSSVRYEVKENSGPWVAATGTYMLTDQSLSGTVLVRAIDSAGNARTELVRFTPRQASYAWLWAVCVLALGVGVFIYLRKRKMHRK